VSNGKSIVLKKDPAGGGKLYAADADLTAEGVLRGVQPPLGGLATATKWRKCVSSAVLSCLAGMASCLQSLFQEPQKTLGRLQENRGLALHRLIVVSFL
jgi:hypothetical protein